MRSLLLIVLTLFSTTSFAAKMCDVELVNAATRAGGQIERRIANSTHSRHGNKHLKARTEADAKSMSKTGDAQFVPDFKGDTSRSALEKLALNEGQAIPHRGDTVYVFYKSDRVVGYDRGKPTYWIRAELTSGDVVHSHPMGLDRVRSYISDAR